MIIESIKIASILSNWKCTNANIADVITDATKNGHLLISVFKRNPLKKISSIIGATPTAIIEIVIIAPLPSPKIGNIGFCGLNPGISPMYCFMTINIAPSIIKNAYPVNIVLIACMRLIFFILKSLNLVARPVIFFWFLIVKNQSGMRNVAALSI